MTRKEKIYLRLGCLFLVVGLVITFSCGTVSFGSRSFHTGWHKEHTEYAEVDEVADIVEAVEEAWQTTDEISEAMGGTLTEASDPINQAFLGGEVARLHINSGLGEIYLSAGTEFYVEDNDGRRSDDVYVSGNTLYIENKGGREQLFITLPSEYVFNSVDIDIEAGYLWIEQLQGTNMMINVGAGELTTGNIISDNNCQISCGAGSITADQMTVNSLSASVGLGTINLTLAGIESANIKTGIGETILNLPRSSKDYDYQISCGAGEVTIDGNSYSGLGRSHGVVNGQGRMLYIDNGMGTTELYFEE